MRAWITPLVLAYLLGSIPFGYLLVRLVRKQDVRATGSGNIGATNVARAGGKGLGIATLLLDCLKGAMAVLLAFQFARHLAPASGAVFDPARAHAFHLACAAAVAAVLGHVFPVWLGFRGGKGVATALGAFLVLSPSTTLCAVLAFLLVFAFSRYVSLASVVAALTVPVAALFFVSSRTPSGYAAFLGIPLLVIAKHHGNLRRLVSGTEQRFGTPGRIAA